MADRGAVMSLNLKKVAVKVSGLLIIFALLLSTISLSGCSKVTNETTGIDLLSMDEIITSLEEEGLTVDKKQQVRALSPVKEKAHIIPAAFRVEDRDDKIYIYVFESIAGRKAVFPHHYNQLIEEDELYFAFSAKNAAIVYEPAENSGFIILPIDRKSVV